MKTKIYRLACLVLGALALSTTSAYAANDDATNVLQKILTQTTYTATNTKNSGKATTQLAKYYQMSNLASFPDISADLVTLHNAITDSNKAATTEAASLNNNFQCYLSGTQKSCLNMGLLNAKTGYTSSQAAIAKSLLLQLNDIYANSMFDIPTLQSSYKKSNKGDIKTLEMIRTAQYTNTVQTLINSVYASFYANHVKNSTNTSVVDAQNAIQTDLNNIFSLKNIAQTNLLALIAYKISEAAAALETIAESMTAMRQSSLLQAVNLQNSTIELRLLARMAYSSKSSAEASNSLPKPDSKKEESRNIYGQ